MSEPSSPGSFTKNVHLGNGGFYSFHNFIRRVFSKRPHNIKRHDWQTELADQPVPIRLVYPNFFLSNNGEILVRDELIQYALTKKYSLSFHCLALFAFHLNNVGNPPRNPQRPAPWANAYVKEVLWSEGAWNLALTEKEPIFEFILDKVKGKSLDKVATNYSYFFKYIRENKPLFQALTTSFQPWIASALFLFFDREIDSAALPDSTEIRTLTTDFQISRLIGCPESIIYNNVEQIFKLYIELGGRNRYNTDTSKQHTPLIDSIDDNGTQDAIEYILSNSRRQVRNKMVVRELKALYDNACFACGKKILVFNGIPYSEVAHIKPVGSPHFGPDSSNNMIILCPNHHKMFDGGTIFFELIDDVIYTKSTQNPNITLFSFSPIKHKIEISYINWHRQWSFSILNS